MGLSKLAGPGLLARGTLIKRKKVNLVPYMTTQPVRLAGINGISMRILNTEKKVISAKRASPIHVISSQVRPSTKCTQ